MSVEERDPHSGYKTTGHEWNGIKELNTPVPRPVYFFLIVTIAFSVAYWVLMPAWPTGLSYTKGLLGIDQRNIVDRDVAEGLAARAAWVDVMDQMPLDTALADPEIMAHVQNTAPALFGDNCAVCHGQNGQGMPGFPNLRDDVWLWGGSPQAVNETMRIGVNSGHAESRISQMPAFGRDQMLPPEDISAVVVYVASLSQARDSATSESSVERGSQVFSTNCASCHGVRGEGNQQLGAPSLIDNEWLYGGDSATIFKSVWYGRQGQMPSWDGRLSSTDRRLLTLYLLDKQKRGQ
ncbi:MAG: cytochrome-c oxidase, cbb3-type subunit III [Bdellovibrionales bacterium]